MAPDTLTQALLAGGLMFIMFSLGLGLTWLDFKRVFAYRRAFVVGVICHFILLPLVGFAVVKIAGITGALAVGFMIIAACPTGTTSNLLTYYARGARAAGRSSRRTRHRSQRVLAINVTMMALAFGLAHAARVERRQAVTVAIESSVQTPRSPSSSPP